MPAHTFEFDLIQCWRPEMVHRNTLYSPHLSLLQMQLATASCAHLHRLTSIPPSDGSYTSQHLTTAQQMLNDSRLSYLPLHILRDYQQLGRLIFDATQTYLRPMLFTGCNAFRVTQKKRGMGTRCLRCLSEHMLIASCSVHYWSKALHKKTGAPNIVAC